MAVRAAARLTATVVLPTPPLGLKTAMNIPLRDQSSRLRGPVWRTAPLPSSTARLRIIIASTRQRIDSGE
jgi:hypothetical protein